MAKFIQTIQNSKINKYIYNYCNNENVKTISCIMGITGSLLNGYYYTGSKYIELTNRNETIKFTDGVKIISHGIYGGICGGVCGGIIPFTLPITFPLYSVYNNIKKNDKKEN